MSNFKKGLIDRLNAALSLEHELRHIIVDEQEHAAELTVLLGK